MIHGADVDEWAGCTNVNELIEVVESWRKLGLFCVACCRLIWNSVIESEVGDLVLIGERCLDGLASLEELDAAYDRVWGSRVISAGLRSNVSNAVWYTVWGIRRSAVLATDSVAMRRTGAFNTAYHSRCVSVNMGMQCDALRDIVNPFWAGVMPVNNSIVGLATTIYGDRDYTLMPILGDALEDAGCTDVSVFEHCRSGKRHYRGCWVVDKILGRE